MMFIEDYPPAKQAELYVYTWYLASYFITLTLSFLVHGHLVTS